MSVVEISFSGLTATLGSITLLWLASLVLRNASIADIFWGAGFVVLGCLCFVLAPQGLSARKLLGAALFTIWGLRLALYIIRAQPGPPGRLTASEKYIRDPMGSGV